MADFEFINPKKAPRPVGPYSTAVVLDNGFLFLSGQIPVDPVSGEVKGENIVEQTEVVFTNISNIIEEIGYRKEEIIKCNIYLKNIEDFKGMNRIYESFFGDHKPVRTTVGVNSLPKDVLIEVEIIAYKR